LPQSAVPPLSAAAKQKLAEKRIQMGSFGVRDKRASVIDEYFRRTEGGKVYLDKFKEDGRKGLENAIDYWGLMVSGDNFGKAFVEVKDPRKEHSVMSKL
jgi:NADPH-dependent curcumin reductase CurA